MVTTPTKSRQQYLDIKAQHEDAILFFRLGDFYEMFDEDAKTAARELDLVLTARKQRGGAIPMCGVPHHAAENYIARLIAKGYKVALCEQVGEDPKSKLKLRCSQNRQRNRQNKNVWWNSGVPKNKPDWQKLKEWLSNSVWSRKQR